MPFDANAASRLTFLSWPRARTGDTPSNAGSTHRQRSLRTGSGLLAALGDIGAQPARSPAINDESEDEDRPTLGTMLGAPSDPQHYSAADLFDMHTAPSTIDGDELYWLQTQSNAGNEALLVGVFGSREAATDAGRGAGYLSYSEVRALHEFPGLCPSTVGRKIGSMPPLQMGPLIRHIHRPRAPQPALDTPFSGQRMARMAAYPESVGTESIEQMISETEDGGLAVAARIFGSEQFGLDALMGAGYLSFTEVRAMRTHPHAIPAELRERVWQMPEARRDELLAYLADAHDSAA